MHTFFVGVVALLFAARHLRLGAAINAIDLALRPQAEGGAHAVHGGIAAADHRRAPADVGLGAQLLRQFFRRQVAAHQKLSGLIDVLQLLAGHLDSVAGGGAVPEEDGIVTARQQLVHAVLAPDVDPALKAHALTFQALDQSLHHFFLQLEVGNAVEQQAAGARPGVKDGDAVAAPGQFFRHRQPGRAGSDHRHLIAAGRHRKLHQEAVGRAQVVGAESLQLADPHRRAPGGEHAGAFTERLLRADASADVGHVAGLEKLLRPLSEAPAGNQEHGLGNVVAHRAGVHAGSVLALQAARGLIDRHLLREAQEGLVPIVHAQVGLLLVEGIGLNAVALVAPHGHVRALEVSAALAGVKAHSRFLPVQRRAGDTAGFDTSRTNAPAL